jgi:hypothetical protein
VVTFATQLRFRGTPLSPREMRHAVGAGARGFGRVGRGHEPPSIACVLEERAWESGR